MSPWPWRRRRVPDVPVQELDLLAMDLETTGLDPSRHEILSIGTVPVRAGHVELGGAQVHLVRPAAAPGVGESATVHGITDDEAARAAPLAEVLPAVLNHLDGRILLAHHASIEVGFLTAGARACSLPVPDLTVVDTVRLHRRVLLHGRGHGHVADDELGLAAARRHLGLPYYAPHDALTDALACAELYLAQVAILSGDGDLTLRDLLR